MMRLLVTPHYTEPQMILLDLDDTLLDHSGAEERAATEFGRQFAAEIPDYDSSTFARRWRAIAEEHYREYLAHAVSFQDQRRRRVRSVLGNQSLSDAEADRIIDLYLQEYERAWIAFDDVEPFLASHGEIRLAILSNGAQAQQEQKLGALGIGNSFEFVLTAESAGMAKPDPGVFALACERAGLPPSAVVYVGDNLEDDALGASAAGLRGVWLSRRGDRPAGLTVPVIHTLLDL
jgi:putative hydrolase of the HAD superfamily